MSGGFELQNPIRHCKTVCIKINLYLINYNRKRTQWTTKGNRGLCDRGLHRYLRNFGGGGVWTPQTPPLGTPLMWDSTFSRRHFPSTAKPWIRLYVLSKRWLLFNSQRTAWISLSTWCLRHGLDISGTVVRPPAEAVQPDRLCGPPWLLFNG